MDRHHPNDVVTLSCRRIWCTNVPFRLMPRPDYKVTERWAFRIGKSARHLNQELDSRPSFIGIPSSHGQFSQPPLPDKLLNKGSGRDIQPLVVQLQKRPESRSYRATFALIAFITG
jgi:hypothetical protein